MRYKAAPSRNFIIVLALTLASLLIIASCGDSATSTAAPQAVAEEAQVPGAVEEVAAAEAAAVAEETAQLGVPKYGGSLTVAMSADSFTLDPALRWSDPDALIHEQLYDNLLTIEPNLSYKPLLATSWEANEDNSSYTFYLRQGVKFHHGKDFKAEDVAFTFNRVLNPDLGSAALITLKAIVDIVVIDDYTVRFDLEGPNAYFLQNVSLEMLRILPADVDVSRLTLEEFGTGPFIIEEHLPGERTDMVRNPDYWDEGKPYLDGITVQLIPEVAIRAEALKNGDVDVIWDLAPQSAPGLEAHPDTVVSTVAATGWIGMEMRVDLPPFDNKLVRQAFQAATDREAIVQSATLGRGSVAREHPIAPSDPLYAPQYAPPAYDPDLARSLLEQAGYPDGIDVVLHTADIGSGVIEMAVAFKESAAPAGIRVDVQRGSADAFWDSVWYIEPFTVTRWLGRLPDQMLMETIDGESIWNAPRYDNPVVNDLIIKARGQDLQGQKESYAEIQRILIDDVPRLIPAFQAWLMGMRTDVRGVDIHPLGFMPLNDAWLDD